MRRMIVNNQLLDRDHDYHHSLMRRFFFCFLASMGMGYGYGYGYGVFSFRYHLGLYAMQELLACRSEIILVYPVRFRMMLIQIITRVYDDSLILHTHQTSIFGWY